MTIVNASNVVCLISDDFLPANTGAGVHVQKLSREMAARGHTVIVITSRRRGQPAIEFWEGVKVYRLFSITVAGFAQVIPRRRTLERIVLDNRVGIMHCHYLGLMMLQALRVARDRGIPAILTAHMSAHHLTQPLLLRPLRPLVGRLIARIYERFADVVCVSAEHARQLGKFNINSRVHHISNPVDFDGSETSAVPQEGRFCVLFAGRLNPEKNIPLLLHAFQLLCEKVPSAELRIAGQGSQDGALRQLVQSLNIVAQTKFLGQVPRDELPHLYAACDVFVLPSLVETQGLVALEAMRFSKPVIVTDRIISARELVDEGSNGFIVDADSPTELADRLAQLAADPSLRESMGRAGFAKSSVYSVESVADAVEDVYLSTVSVAPRQLRRSDFDFERRKLCVFCKIGSFERRAEHVVIESDAHQFQEDYFGVWRCAYCQSFHSLTKFPLEDYYLRSPFLKRKLNAFNRQAFIGFHRWVVSQGVNPQQRLLFYGVNATMFKTVFEEKGFTHFDTFEQTLGKSPAGVLRGAYDVVVILDYFERAEDPNVVFDFAQRLLVRGGILILHTPDAAKIKFPFHSAQRLHQPYRIHVASLSAVSKLARETGFEVGLVARRHYQDTWVPFINYRAFQELSFFGDGSLDSAIAFTPRKLLKRFWRIPRYLMLGLFGGWVRDPSNLLLVLTLTESERVAARDASDPLLGAPSNRHVDRPAQPEQFIMV